MCTPIHFVKTIMMKTLAGKHESNKDELGTQLVNAVFAEKLYTKRFKM